MRYERKYRIEERSYEQVLRDMLHVYGAFDTSYPDRWVNSVYLDDINFKAMRENLAGISDRSKFRLRWYGENKNIIHNPVLEEKVKANMLGFKNNDSLRSGQFSPEYLRSILTSDKLKNIQVEPVVLIRYLRTYLESFDHRIRITIDRNLNYFGMSSYAVDPFPILDDAIILEVKYDQEIEDEIQDTLQSIQYRLTKNSKFVSGMLGYWG